MKKKLSLILALVLAGTMLFTGCGSSDSDSSASSSADASTGGEAKEEGDTFTVGFDAEFPPYGYKNDDGEYVGFDLDLAQEVCDRNGWKLVKQPIDWDSKDAELSSGTIDCIWNGFTITGREDEYTWTDAYLDNSQIVIVNKDSGIKTLEDLAGKVVIVQADSSALAAFEGDQADLAATFAELQQIPDYNSAFMSLKSGAADAVALDYGVAQGYLNSDSDYIMLDEEVSSEQYAVGFKKGNTALRDQVQATLEEMNEDGTLEKIAENYADYNIPEMLCFGK
jgi:polar amino acid transport system substrate-binding protein